MDYSAREIDKVNVCDITRTVHDDGERRLYGTIEFQLAGKERAPTKPRGPTVCVELSIEEGAASETLQEIELRFLAAARSAMKRLAEFDNDFWIAQMDHWRDPRNAQAEIEKFFAAQRGDEAA